MSKKRIKVIIQNEEQIQEEELMALMQNDIIHYIEKDGTHTVYDKNKNQLKRSNKELNMEYIFIEGETTNGLIVVKELNKRIDIPVTTKKIIIEDHAIEIRYQANEEEYKYRIEEII